MPGYLLIPSDKVSLTVVQKFRCFYGSYLIIQNPALWCTKSFSLQLQIVEQQASNYHCKIVHPPKAPTLFGNSNL